MNDRCLIIAEVAQGHDGSLGLAHAYVEAIARAGADAVKFQTHIAAAESSHDEPWRVKFSRQDETRYQYWERMQFSEAHWSELRSHAHERGLKFLSSPFSPEAVALLTRIGVDAWKIPSGEVGNPLLLASLRGSGKPVLLSTGMSPLSEIDAAVVTIKDMGLPLTILQCTSIYPCPPDKVGLNQLALLRDRYGCPVGLSDHTGLAETGLAAVALGATALEVHVTLSKEMFGPDVPVSLTTEALATLVRGVRNVEVMRSNPVDKDAVAGELAGMRGLFTKSLVALTDLPAGTTLTRAHLGARKPGTGIPVGELEDVVGRTLARPVASGARLSRDDLS